MKDIIYFNAYLTIISVCALISFLIPIAMKWTLIELASVENPPVLVALQSNKYQISLVVSLSVSAPMCLELLLRILNANLEFVVPNAIIIMSLAIPDLMVLLYVRPYADLIFLNYVLRARLLLFLWLVFIFIKKYGQDKWSNVWLLSSFTFLCIGRLTAFYRGFFTQNTHDVLSYLSFISDTITIVICIISSISWYRFILNERKQTAITTQQYMCNVYVTAALVMLTGFYIRLYSSQTTLEWYNWNTNQLCVYSVMFTIFYSVVMVFQGRAFQREMLQTKVS